MLENYYANFFDTQGLEIEELECEDASDQTNNFCIFKNLEPLERRKVSLTLKTPESVPSPTDFTITYYVKYNHFGYKESM